MRIIGHQHNQERLRKQFEAGAFPQSVLFVGPEAVGKFTVAFELAKELGGAAAFEPTEGAPTPQDVLVIQPEIHATKSAVKELQIKVEEIRRAIDFLSRYPSTGTFRVVIIRDAHLLSEEAQNALLKVLEEPNPSSVLILVTHYPERLLATIRSRLIREHFALVPEPEMTEAYSETLLKEAQIPLFFRGFGRPGVLTQALAEPEAFQREKALLTELYQMSLLSLSDRLILAETLSKDIPETCKLMNWWLPGLHERARQETEPKRRERYFEILSEINRVLALLKTTNANPRLLLEQLLLGV